VIALNRIYFRFGNATHCETWAGASEFIRGYAATSKDTLLPFTVLWADGETSGSTPPPTPASPSPPT
jgi:hypothetical protein